MQYKTSRLVTLGYTSCPTQHCLALSLGASHHSNVGQYSCVWVQLSEALRHCQLSATAGHRQQPANTTKQWLNMIAGSSNALYHAVAYCTIIPSLSCCGHQNSMARS